MEQRFEFTLEQRFEYKGFQVDVAFTVPDGGSHGTLAAKISPLSEEASKITVATKAHSNQGPSMEVFPPHNDAATEALMRAGFDLARREIDQRLLLADELRQPSKAEK